MNISQINENSIKKLKQAAVEATRQKIINNIKKRINNDIKPLEAFNLEIDNFKLDEELIIFYELQAEKSGYTTVLDLSPKEVELMEEQVKKELFSDLIKQI